MPTYKGKDGVWFHPPLAPGERCPIVDSAHAIREAMTMKLKGYDVNLTATPKIGYSWSNT
jgi:hypothetical protein